MKAITILQPFASLIACGAKRFETRSRKTNYRGKIAIHAGIKTYRKAPNDVAEQACKALGLDYAPLDKYCRLWGEFLPTGAVIAVAELVNCWCVARDEYGAFINRGEPFGEAQIEEINCNELLFGDFSEGRYAWELANVKPLNTPILCKWKQGFWEWNPAAP